MCNRDSGNLLLLRTCSHYFDYLMHSCRYDNMITTVMITCVASNKDSINRLALKRKRITLLLAHIHLIGYMNFMGVS